MADEYISKEKALNLIEHNDKVCHYADKQYEDIVYATTQKICEAVADMPAADLQPVKSGKWEGEHYNEQIECYEANCSECGYESTDKYRITDNHRYCEYCGTRMDLKDGDTECHDTK